MQIAGQDQTLVVCHGDADNQPVGLFLVQAADLRDARIGTVGTDQLGQPTAHAAQHQRIPEGMVVAIGGAAAESGSGAQLAARRGKKAAQTIKACGLGKALLEVALTDLKAAQPVHCAVLSPQGQHEQLHLF